MIHGESDTSVVIGEVDNLTTEETEITVKLNVNPMELMKNVLDNADEETKTLILNELHYHCWPK